MSRFSGQAPTGSTADFLAGDWNVERRISDHRSGQAGLFRGTASFRPCASGVADRARPADEPGQAGQVRSVLKYQEHGELWFGGHHGPAGRSLLYCDLADGSADVRFADGREFYRLDLRTGACQADHPCQADQYHVTVTRLSSDSFAETWQVAGPGKDYEIVTAFRRAVTGPAVTGPADVRPADAGPDETRLGDDALGSRPRTGGRQ